MAKAPMTKSKPRPSPLDDLPDPGAGLGFPWRTEQAVKGSWRWPLGAPLPGSKEFEALPWPDETPILAAGNICDRGWELDRRRSLEEWVTITFNPTRRAESFAESVAQLVLREVVAEITGVREAPWVWLEEKKASRAKAAAAFNEAMRRLGYAGE